MKKKKHYLSLITIITLMVIIVSILSYNSKKKIEVEVLEGSNKDLGDISLVYTPGNSILNKREVVLSKNGIENNFKSQKQIDRDYIDIDSKYNSFIKWESEDSFYENEKHIGKIVFNMDFDKENKDTYIEIKQKNKKNNVTEKIKIKLDNKIFKHGYITPISTSAVDNEIYIVTNQYETANLQIMKIDLKNKTYKVLKNIYLKDGNNESNVNNMKFLHDNKIYTEIYCYDSKREYTYFMIYDIEKNTITKSNEFMNKIEKQGAFLTQNIFDYQVIDNKLNVLIGDKEGNVSKLIYKINDKEIKLINSVKLNFKLKYNQDFLNFNQVRARLIDNKIYSLSTLNGYVDEYSNYTNLKAIKPTEFIIFDINDNKVIYKAKLLNADKNRYDNLHFVKNY